MISLIIKILIALLGLGVALFFWIIGLTDKSDSYVRTGWMVGLTTISTIAAIILIEYLLSGS